MQNYQDFLKKCPVLPGVYQMLSANKEILYVGKAQNLKSRVSSYFRQTGLSAKTEALMKQVVDIVLTVTQSDTEALILECRLIKAHRPRYNILLRDDKTMPHIFLREDHAFPQLLVHRGKKEGKGRYFGPFTNSGAVYESLDLLQKVFCLRACHDTEFKNRSRPCLLYEVKRCRAPCVGAITPEAYAEDVKGALQFLTGQSRALMSDLTLKMEVAAQAMNYEQAAHYRDQIRQLRVIQEKQYVSSEKGEGDVLALAYQENTAVVYLLKIRQGQVIGGCPYYPRVPEESSRPELLLSFIAQLYINADIADIPKQIIVSDMLAEKTVLAEVLTKQCGYKVEVLDHVKTEKAQWLEMARLNAEQNLMAKLASQAKIHERWVALKNDLQLEAFPNRIECFDISHTLGEATVAACVVFNETGLLARDCRRYDISGVVGGDDCGALRQVFRKRYFSMQAASEPMPGVILVDGGKGQLAELIHVFKELKVEAILLGIAKGASRRHGLETIYRAEGDQVVPLQVSSLTLHFLRQIDDKAHEWAITGHQKKRDKNRFKSRLDLIPGIGKVRRQELLRFFGSLDVMRRVSLEEISKVPGISETLAQKIYKALHDTD